MPRKLLVFDTPSLAQYQTPVAGGSNGSKTLSFPTPQNLGCDEDDMPTQQHNTVHVMNIPQVLGSKQQVRERPSLFFSRIPVCKTLFLFPAVQTIQMSNYHLRGPLRLSFFQFFFKTDLTDCRFSTLSMSFTGSGDLRNRVADPCKRGQGQENT